MNWRPQLMFRRLVRAAFGLIAAFALSLLTLELLLTAWPDLLPIRLANHAFSKYGTFPGGISYLDLVSDIQFMRANYCTRTYFNGYTWQHSTDALGFRNPAEWRDRSLVLLGDSLIYGHGVEQMETVAHFLRSEHGRPAYNMARQGDCLFQSYVVLRLNLAHLNPDTVVLFVFLNDFSDLELYRTPGELTARPEIGWDYEAMGVRLVEREAHVVLSPKRILLGLKGVRMLFGFWKEAGQIGLVSTAEAAPADESGLPYLDVLLDRERLEPLADYYAAVLEDLSERLDRRGADLWIVNLDVGLGLGERADRARRNLAACLERICCELGARCASTTDLFEGCQDCFLPGDGHLSPAGHRRLAQFIDRMLDSQVAFDGPQAERPAEDCRGFTRVPKYPRSTKGTE